MNEYDDRLRDLDAAGIDKQLIMCPPPQCYYTVKTGHRRQGDPGGE